MIHDSYIECYHKLFIFATIKQKYTAATLKKKCGNTMKNWDRSKYYLKTTLIYAQ